MNLQQEFVGTMHRIIDRDNPETLRNTVFVSLDVPAMIKYNNKLYIAFSDKLSHELQFVESMPIYELSLVRTTGTHPLDVCGICGRYRKDHGPGEHHFESAKYRTRP